VIGITATSREAYHTHIDPNVFQSGCVKSINISYCHTQHL